MQRALTFPQVRLVPVHNNISSRSEPTLKTRLTRDIDMDIPILAANMESVIGPELAIELQGAGSIPIYHRFADMKTIRKWVALHNGPCFISSGVSSNSMADAHDIIKDTGADGVCIDVAHGHYDRVYRAIEFFKKNTSAQVIAGNVCTADGYRDLVNAGADCVKVGIGPGAACTTRNVTGFGVPQMQACLDVGDAAKKLRIPFIADGGINSSGEIVLALAAGASSVMLGKMFAQCSESAGVKQTRGGKTHGLGPDAVYLGGSLHTLYRGQASEHFQREGFTPEGEEQWLPVTGSAKDLIQLLCGGIQSGFTYGGSRDIYELQRKAEFIEVGTGA